MVSRALEYARRFYDSLIPAASVEERNVLIDHHNCFIAAKPSRHRLDQQGIGGGMPCKFDAPFPREYRAVLLLQCLHRR